LRIGRHKANISRSEPNVWLKLIRFFLPFRLRIQPHRLGFLWKPHYPSGKSHGASTACYMRRPASGPLADQYPATCLQVPVWCSGENPQPEAVYVFITVVPMMKLFAWGEGDSGGHVLRETTGRSLCGLGCPSRTSERGGESDCVKEGGGGEGERERERALGVRLRHIPRH
jgi:hypothetical protein